MASGKLTREDAKELMSMLLIKMNDVTMLQAGFRRTARGQELPVRQGQQIGTAHDEEDMP